MAEHWRRQGLTADFLFTFWQRIWRSQQPRRTVTFQWLVAHRAIAVGTWLSYGGRPPDCSGCGHFQETQRHCLWDCPLAQQVWRRILRIFSRTCIEQIYTWGAAAWGTLSGPALGYETAADSIALLAQRGHLSPSPVPDFSTATWSREGDPRWELISSLALWFIWRARCRRIFEERPVPPAETVRDFWTELIHTLRGQYDRLQGDSDSMILRRLAFLRLWKSGPFLLERHSTIQWCYSPPVWLFPPPHP